MGCRGAKTEPEGLPDDFVRIFPHVGVELLISLLSLSEILHDVFEFLHGLLSSADFGLLSNSSLFAHFGIFLFG